jgi:hypothetical protein
MKITRSKEIIISISNYNIYQDVTGLKIEWVIVQIKMTVELNFVSSGEDERVLGSTVKIFLLQIADRVHHWLTPIGGLDKCFFFKYIFGVPHLATFISFFIEYVIALALLTSIQYTAGFEPTTSWT